MPITYERDDQRRLITVTVTDPYSIDDIVGAIGRQAAEDTWGYAAFYDLRVVSRPPREPDLQQIVDWIRDVGSGRERPKVGLAVGASPEQFRMGLLFMELTRKLVTVEVLLTATQINGWLARNARGGSPHRP